MSIKNHLQIASYLSQLLYTVFKIGRFQFGFYLLLGITPGVADVISFFISIYTLWIGKQLSIPKKEMNQMLKNIFLDLFVGIFPVLGEVVNTQYKAHVKNVKILKRHASNVIEGEVVS